MRKVPQKVLQRQGHGHEFFWAGLLCKWAVIFVLGYLYQYKLFLLGKMDTDCAISRVMRGHLFD